MLGEVIDQTLDRFPALSSYGLKLARAIHNEVLQRGESTRNLADLLHGTWLGHPLHPVLTDAAIGAWSFAMFFDLMSMFKDSYEARVAADALLELGNYVALPTVLAGLTDFSTVPGGSADTAMMHATVNTAVYSLFLASMKAREDGDRSRAVTYSTIAGSLLMAGAYLGGHLSFSQKVGVNHAEKASDPRQWTPVVAEADLKESEPMRVEAGGSPVLLYRRGQRVMAIGAVCGHAGGPLEKGQFADDTVECPWHQSVYSLDDGEVVHGPTTYPVANYDARIRDGEVELRLRRG